MRVCLPLQCPPVIIVFLAVFVIVIPKESLILAVCPPNTTHGKTTEEQTPLYKNPIGANARCMSQLCSRTLSCDIKAVHNNTFIFQCNHDFESTHRLRALAIECLEFMDSDGQQVCFGIQSCIIVYSLHWMLPLYIIIGACFGVILVLALIICWLCLWSEETLVVQVPQTTTKMTAVKMPGPNTTTAHLPYKVFAKLATRRDLRGGPDLKRRNVRSDSGILEGASSEPTQQKMTSTFSL